MKKLAATSLWGVDYTAKILFTLQLIFNGVIMSASSFMLPGKLMAGLALGNTVIKGLETHFKFEHTVETLREALALINGVSVTASIASLAIIRAQKLLDATICAQE